MSKIISKFASLLPNSGNIMLSGALAFSLIPLPFANVFSPTSKEIKETVVESAAISLGNIFFGKAELAHAETEIIEDKMAFVSSRDAYPASLSVVQKHAETIKRIAREKGVPEEVAIGVALLENGGSETAVSKAGALGVFQLMPGTARSLGLTVNKKVDERKDPYKNISAGITYLQSNYERFGDWGLATWAYHAGEGNVSKALKLYAKANHGVTLPGVGSPAEIRAYVEKHDVSIDRLLSSAAVKPLTKKLNDDSAGYPYKVIATAKLFEEARNGGFISPGKVER